MIRTWIEAIYDRTYGSVQSVQYDPYQENPKGCWNAVDLNRIEKNTAYCAEWMLEKKIVRVAPEITVRENDYWTGSMIPTKAEIDRILNNVRLLVQLSSNNPAIADQLPNIYAATQINYVLANEIEFALDLMHNQPKLPLEYWRLNITNGVIKSIVRDGGTIEYIGASEALVAEDEEVTILGVEYGDDAQYQTFTHWSGNATDIGLLNNYQSKETNFVMPYRAVSFTANFETHIPRTLTVNSGYISISLDPAAESGPSTGTYYAGDQIMVIANIAPEGKAFYEWTGTQAGLDNIVGVTNSTDPSTVILTMPDCDVTLSPYYINAGQHYVTVNYGTGSGWYNYGDNVTISATVPSHYAFSNWSGNTSYLNDIHSSSQSFRMGDSNISFTAHFTYVYSYNSVQVIDGLINVDGTNVASANNLRQTTSYTLIPTPPDNSQGIYNWTIEGKGSVDSDSLGNCGNTFTVGDGNAIITAHYDIIKTLTVDNLNNNGETTTYSIVKGRKQMLTTSSVTGNYRFNGWYENGERLSTSTNLTVTIGNDNRTIEARYDWYDTYTVTLVNKNNNGSTTTSSVLSGNYWSASTNEEAGDYLLVGWNKDGTQVSTSTSYGFYVSSNTTITVEYRPKETYYLTVNNGTGSGYYKERQSVSITADSSLGDFSNWSTSNIYSIGNSRNRTTTVKLGRSDGTVTANFNMRNITVVTTSGTNTYSVVQGDSITINGSSSVQAYEFNHWEVTSGDATLANVYSSSTRVYAQSQDSTITAIYDPVEQFVVKMDDGYVWDGSDWVGQATLYKGSTNAIKMQPAPTGYQFLQWDVYVNGVLQTDANDVYEPLAETTRLRNLTRNITIQATYYIPNPEVKYTLTITRKDGTIQQNEYSAGTDITIRASNPDAGYEFYKWTGDTSYIAGGAYQENSYVHMPAQNVSIQENYVPEGYIPTYDIEMKNIYGQCCYTTEYESITTDHWVSRWSYPEGSIVRIRATGYDAEYYFSEWNVVNHDTSADARSVVDNISSTETTLTMPDYDIDITPIILLKQTYELRINDGGTSGYYYEGRRADVYFNKVDTNDVHYQFLRWTGGTGTDISSIELYDGGMFNVLISGDSTTPQYIKMPGKRTEITANYKTLYRITLTNGIINEISTNQGFYETGTTLHITANTAPIGMRFQYWTGDTSRLGSIYDPTTTVQTTGGVTNITAVYSTDAERNDIGYVNSDLKSTSTISNNSIIVISGTIETGFIITDLNGHIYLVTSVNDNDNTSTIYRMTKIVQGGNIYG